MIFAQLYSNSYKSPFGTITLASDGKNLVGLWFLGQKYYMEPFLKNKVNFVQKNLPVFDCAKEWLNLYFKGQNPNFEIETTIFGTDFQKDVFEILKTIPYGKTMTYKEITEIIQKKRGILKMSSQATGNTIGRNPVSIIIPCHRVIGKNGNLTGYAAGVSVKEKLLRLENFISL